ncbi:LLM class flavin-dependent oxidoreductase [Streptosporangium lutulentum]|uniref:Alkanesulfonate monooxygenase SsuD/methylene tetrahydromethanopterin reductase-like flavin-dependent oxidoreductase (Luciferase family) n=1 Tax=Streptosporangium lutulentum TaxID=1461250 RepID=A0ABT9QDB3_9ACTN|nr:LLM class flavin-dependent oxidoreductase [Streptosporangium lutulentum]MDP9844356.1 alkanesulfonate monooxygenase SsuD/methylene tetrahydromethanopterin reductase-like flavin-dependent oxidoreductase (luciferase family) [Streptosporangium lutulentum]
MSAASLHLAVALDGAGWHPAAWRDPAAFPKDLFTAAYWAALVAEAERGLLDFVTIEDSLALQSTRHEGPDGRTDQVRGRFDALLVASRIAPLTGRIGLVPTVTTTHTEPFHIASGLATLDYVSGGRAGWRAQVSGRGAEAAHFGRRDIPGLRPESLDDPETVRLIHELFDEAADVVEVVRRLWDSWEDDAVIRDVPTGRFVDRDRLHYIDFEGSRFSVKGPSIVPRPPQGQPPVTALAHARVPYEFAARGADVVYVTPHDAEQARAIVEEVRGIGNDVLKIFADLVVYVGEDARERKARLDELDGAGHVSDAAIFTGTPGELADLILDWRRAGLEGFRLRPAVLPTDLGAITRRLVPELQRRGAFRSGYEAATLRGHLGLPRPAGRYAGSRR